MEITKEICDYGFDGSIKIKMLPYEKRMKAALEFSQSKDSDEEKSMRLLEMVGERITGVSLKYGDIEINSIDELGCYQEGVQLINTMGSWIVSGVPLAKSSESSLPEIQE